MSRFWLIVLYANGALRYIGALLGSVFAQIEAHRQSSDSDGTSSNLDQESSFSVFTRCASTSLLIAGLICTCVYCATFALHYQIDLLRVLFSSFDYMFSLAQYLCLSLGLCDMVYWRSRSIGFITAAIWYLWIPTLDVLTPSVKSRFHFKKKYLVIVMATFLTANVLDIVGVLLDEFNSFQDRTTVSYRIDAHKSESVYRALPQRIIAILVRSSRLMRELVTQDKDELLFLRGHLEYLSPFDTLPSSTPPPPVSTSSSATAGSSAVLPLSELNNDDSGREIVTVLGFRTLLRREGS